VIDDDAKAIIRTQRDVLMEARPFVAAVMDKYDALLLGVKLWATEELLARIDGAIAEADEVLS